MKMYATAALGATLLAGTAVAFTRRSAPAVIRRSSVAAFASPAEFAKSEIASNDVSACTGCYYLLSIAISHTTSCNDARSLKNDVHVMCT